MYVITRERLGAPPENELQEFLDEVRASLQGYKRLLLTLRLHPFPLESSIFKHSLVGLKQEKTIVKVALLAGSTPEQVLK
jgi:hypothetical protein